MDDDEYIIDISTMSTSDTITVTGDVSDVVYDNSVVYDNWITIGDNIDLDILTIYQPVEFEDEMPSVAKVEDMCRDYPALEKAYENFKTVYKLVRQDWQGKQDEQS